LSTNIATLPDQRWHLLLPKTAVIVDLALPTEAHDLLAGVPSGTRVAVVGGPRSRRFARRHRVIVERVYLVVPSLAEPLVVTDTTGNALSWFTGSILTVPSGRTRLHLLFWTAVRVARRWPRLLAHAPIGERIVIGACR
jgi:hypothetical protein